LDDALPDELVAQARRGSTEALGRLLALYRNYLKLLAQLHVDDYLQAKADPSDVVQDACLQAHCDFADFRGTTEREFIGWLSEILTTKSAKFQRRYAAQRRNVHLERQLQDDSDQSTAALQTFATSAVASPSEDATRRERAVLVADALMELSAPYREVIILHHFRGLTMPQVASRLGRSVNSVQKLWGRALLCVRRSLNRKL
jgi:RNA polymerase sigma-70 factor (ECF subfamily)